MILKVQRIHLSGLSQFQVGLVGCHYTHNASVDDQNETSFCLNLYLHRVKENRYSPNMELRWECCIIKSLPIIICDTQGLWRISSSHYKKCRWICRNEMKLINSISWQYLSSYTFAFLRLFIIFLIFALFFFYCGQFQDLSTRKEI